MLQQNQAIRYVIVDDEEGAIDDLRWELNNQKHALEEVVTFSNPAEAALRLQQLELDLLFLDISMPFMDGFRLVETLEAVAFDIVFTTAYNQHAVEAFRHNAIDYLLKPVSEAELSRVLEKHLSSRLTKDMRQQLAWLNQVFKAPEERLKIYVKDEYRYLPFSEIIHLEAKSNYTLIYTDKEDFLVSYPLKEYEQQLPSEAFIKVHRSHIVNKNAITGVGNSLSRYLVLSNSHKVPVSRSKFMDIKSLLDAPEQGWSLRQH